jgi:Phage terminase large subunit (GpA)
MAGASTKSKSKAKKAAKPPLKKGVKRRKQVDKRYERHREQAAVRSRNISSAGREIGPIPAVADKKRRAEGLGSLRRYCEIYKRAKFYLDWSADQLEAIAILEDKILNGGTFSLAMERGGGKTQLLKAAAEWAILRGAKHFVMVVAATTTDAKRVMADIKATFESNPLVVADFPEVSVPIRKLGGINQRAGGQTQNCRPTNIAWKKEEIRFPDVEGSAAAGAAIFTRGILGAIRGANVTTPDGGSMRPDLVLIDDAQTRASAKSLNQTEDRELILLNDVMKLPAGDVAGTFLMACTVIYPGDLSDRFLDHERHPEWSGKRFQTLKSFPKDMKLWEEYSAMRRESFRVGGRGQEANAFYKANKKAMDEGAVVSWEAQKQPEDLSALQTRMNWFFRDPDSFWAEGMNRPRSRTAVSDCVQLDANKIVARLTSIPRGAVPRTCNRLTAAIDVQANILYWLVAAWDDHFGGSILDYGTFPEQRRLYFAAADAAPSLAKQFPNFEERGQIYAGLRALTSQILGRSYQRHESGGTFKVERCLIDSGYSTPTIYQFCRESAFSTILYPSKGYGIGARSLPMAEYPKREGERPGWGFIIGAPERARARVVKIDANTWKSFLAERLLLAAGTPGQLQLPGAQAREHQLLADHLASEFRTPTEGRGRKLEEWQLRPGKSENHWLDALVMAGVAAAVQGLEPNAARAAGERVGAQAPTPQTNFKEARAQREREAREARAASDQFDE